MIVLLHGLGGSPKDMEPLRKKLQGLGTIVVPTANQPFHGVMLGSVEVPPPSIESHDSGAWFRVNTQIVNEAVLVPTEEVKGYPKASFYQDFEGIDTSVDEIMRTASGIPGARAGDPLVIVGYSMGAFVSFYMSTKPSAACENIIGCVAMHGWYPGTLTTVYPKVPILMTSSVDDPMFNRETMIETLRMAKVDISPIDPEWFEGPKSGHKMSSAEYDRVHDWIFDLLVKHGVASIITPLDAATGR